MDTILVTLLDGIHVFFGEVYTNDFYLHNYIKEEYTRIKKR